jgi:cystathionine beta-synthase
MVTELHTVDVDTPVSELVPVFDAGYVAMVREGGRFIGLVTRLDLLNYLRRSSALD